MSTHLPTGTAAAAATRATARLQSGDDSEPTTTPAEAQISKGRSSPEPQQQAADTQHHPVLAAATPQRVEGTRCVDPARPQAPLLRRPAADPPHGPRRPATSNLAGSRQQTSEHSPNTHGGPSPHLPPSTARGKSGEHSRSHCIEEPAQATPLPQPMPAPSSNAAKAGRVDEPHHHAAAAHLSGTPRHRHTLTHSTRPPLTRGPPRSSTSSTHHSNRGEPLHREPPAATKCPQTTFTHY